MTGPTDPHAFPWPRPPLRRVRTFAELAAAAPWVAQALDALQLAAAQRAAAERLVVALWHVRAVAEAGVAVQTARQLVGHAPPGEAARWAAVAQHVLAANCGGCVQRWPPATVEAERPLAADHVFARAGAWDKPAVEAFLQALAARLVAHGHVSAGTSTRADGVVLHARLTLPEPAAWQALVQQALATVA
jgi:hypothetical protein